MAILMQFSSFLFVLSCGLDRIQSSHCKNRRRDLSPLSIANWIEASHTPSEGGRFPRPCWSPEGHHQYAYSLRSGGSQFTLTSQWESRNVRTSPLAIDAPKRRVRMSPSLFLVRTILTLENRAIYSSNLSFKWSRNEEENVEKNTKH